VSRGLRSCRSPGSPTSCYFPEGEPWLHYADSLPFPVEAGLRMKLIPPPRPARTSAAGWRTPGTWTRTSGKRAWRPDRPGRADRGGPALEHGIAKERLPFVYGHHRLLVTAPTRELCVRRTEAVTERYRDAGIDVVNSTGDQFSLLCESLLATRSG
jgi:hypothetical protein